MCLNVFWNFSNLVFCLSIVVSDFVFMDSTCLHVWGISVVFVLLCFPHSLLICLFIFVLVDSLFYWPVCFLRSERKKAWT